MLSDQKGSNSLGEGGQVSRGCRRLHHVFSNFNSDSIVLQGLVSFTAAQKSKWASGQMLLGVLLGVLYGQQYIFMILGCWENDCIYNSGGSYIRLRSGEDLCQIRSCSLKSGLCSMRFDKVCLQTNRLAYKKSYVNVDNNQ